ncbi:NBS-LRR resistance-like protein [Gossypium australe]|uniref:NBS-LRR resistance-like protein n=1 Tax=Gossypium australe TaxID=47621 RepID=A0A5B6VA59_9ROSI|nr:NBS-LRR resistance-like protein [Gossypium australe]
MFVQLSVTCNEGLLMKLQVRQTLSQQINTKQAFDEELRRGFTKWRKEYEVASHSTRKELCVPKDKELQQMILSEALNSSFAMHPDSNKMYHDLHELYWWFGLKRVVTEYVKVKAKHQFPLGLLQPLKIPK